MGFGCGGFDGGCGCGNRGLRTLVGLDLINPTLFGDGFDGGCGCGCRRGCGFNTLLWLAILCGGFGGGCGGRFF